MVGDFEGILISEEFVGERAQRPKVDLAVVAFSAEHLGGEIEGSAADSFSQFLWLVDGPAEIANFCHSLHYKGVTWVKTMF